MKIISITKQTVYDGGWVVYLIVWPVRFYFRRRGPNNKVKPRHLFDYELIPKNYW